MKPDLAITNGELTVFVPFGVRELMARKLALEVVSDFDPDIYPDLWDALAEDYEKVYGTDSIAAAACRRKAEHYRSV
jgi:hypothetical protein